MDAINGYTLILFFLPGFVSLQVYRLLIPGDKSDYSRSLHDIIGFGALNLASCSWLIYIAVHGNWIETEQARFVGLLILVTFILPSLWPVVYVRLSKSKFFRDRFVSPIKAPWDEIFSKRESLWVVIYLNSGDRIGGMYGTKSYASSYPAKEQIYIEEVWELDDKAGFVKVKNRTEGMIFLHDDISRIEFFH